MTHQESFAVVSKEDVFVKHFFGLAFDCVIKYADYKRIQRRRAAGYRVLADSLDEFDFVPLSAHDEEGPRLPGISKNRKGHFTFY